MRLVAIALLGLLAACSDERPRLVGPSVGVHADGFADPASPSFHGHDLERRGWDLNVCAKCHGGDFSGGTAAVSCLTCHPQGPTTCTTCHDTPPSTGAHAAHAFACETCHKVPAKWDDPGHVLNDPPPAEVKLTGLGALKPGAVFSQGGCQNVYCHAGATPTWTTPTGNTCGTCHTNPPPSHKQNYTCVTCHPADAPHIDGVVQIGREPGCGGCHGDPISGAHQAHLLGPQRLRGPVTCGSCHLVPTEVTDPGHIDSDAPAEVLAALNWDGAADTCTSSGCHGAATPHWTQTGEVTCGTCHGIPPGGNHIQGVTLSECTICHTRTVDATGTILFTPEGRSEHIDGDVDFQ